MERPPESLKSFADRIARAAASEEAEDIVRMLRVSGLTEDIASKPAVRDSTETGAVFADGSTDEFDAAVLATGYRPAVEEIVAVPGVLDDEGYPLDWKGGAHPGLFFVGYHQPPTGLLREIAIQAEAVASAIARA